MLLNHIHARGIPASNDDLYNSSDEVNDVLYDFIALIGEIDSGDFVSNSRTTSGLVADKPPLMDFPYPLQRTLHIIANDPGKSFLTFPRSVTAGSRPINTELPSFQGSYWLVRTGDSLKRLDIEGAKYELGELVVPSVHVDGQYYSLSMNYWSEIGGLLQITGLEKLDAPQPEFYGNFDEETGELDIQYVAVCSSESRIHNFNLKMGILRYSNPVIFQITHSSQWAQDIVAIGEDPFDFGECVFE